MLNWPAQTSRPIAWPNYNLQAIAGDRQFRKVPLKESGSYVAEREGGAAHGHNCEMDQERSRPPVS